MRKIIPMRQCDCPECTDAEKAVIKLMVKHSHVKVHNDKKEALLYKDSVIMWKLVHRVSMPVFVPLHERIESNGKVLECVPATFYNCDENCHFSKSGDYNHCPACNPCNRQDGRYVQFQEVDQNDLINT